MGTRGLTCVALDGEFKVAQYGQWDHYPSGQGSTILEFLTNPEMKIQNFIEQVRRLKWITDDQAEKIYAEPGWNNTYPWLSRDTGAEVLKHIYNGDVEATGLVNMFEFGHNSLMCEWAYVIDLDNRKLEVYQGFNRSGTVIGRWAVPYEGPERYQDYLSVTQIQSYDLDTLPDLQTFVKECDPEEDDE